MLTLVLFWTLTATGCAYAAAAGGRDGRWAAIMIVAASVLSVPAILLGRGWTGTDHGVLAVDVLLLVGLYGLSLRSRRFFSLWMCGFQLVAVTTHLATMLVPDFTPGIYRAVESIWAIPITLAMIAGIALDVRHEERSPDPNAAPWGVGTE